MAFHKACRIAHFSASMYLQTTRTACDSLILYPITGRFPMRFERNHESGFMSLLVSVSVPPHFRTVQLVVGSSFSVGRDSVGFVERDKRQILESRYGHR